MGKYTIEWQSTFHSFALLYLLLCWGTQDQHLSMQGHRKLNSQNISLGIA